MKTLIDYPDGTSNDEPDENLVRCKDCGWKGWLKELNLVAINTTLCPKCNSERVEYVED